MADLTITKIPKATGTTVIGDSAITDTGTGVSISTPLTLSGAPTLALHAATKAYVDSSPAGSITGVTAGSGLSGGGTSGTVTVSLTQPVPVAAGGTNATTAPAALTSLGAVAKAGDTMSGTLTVGPLAGGALTILRKPASGQVAGVLGYNGANQRWGLTLGNGTAESGSGDTGSDFEVLRYSDVGAFLGTPLLISRATGNATFGGAVTAAGGAMFGGNISSVGQNISVNNAANPTLAITNSTGTPLSLGFINSSSMMWTAVLSSGLGYVSMMSTLDGSGNLTIAGGTATKPGGGSWVAPSGRDLKENVVEYNRGLDAVLQLTPVIYSYNGKAGLPADGTRYVGLIADEVEPVMPEMVGSAALPQGPDVQAVEVPTIDNSSLVYALVNAIKELSAKVAALETKP